MYGYSDEAVALANEYGSTDSYGSYRLHRHSRTCTEVTLENMEQNARDDRAWTGEDSLTQWDTVWGSPVAKLLAEWLADGTATCICDDHPN